MSRRAARRRSTPSTEIPESIRRWAEEIAALAEVDLTVEDDGWRVRAKPRAKGAVGFTLRMTDSGDYDLLLDAGLRHEGWPWPEDADPEALCRAIAAGRVSAEVYLWHGRLVWRLVAIECPPNVWTDLTSSLLDFVIPKGWRTRMFEKAAPY